MRIPSRQAIRANAVAAVVLLGLSTGCSDLETLLEPEATLPPDSVAAPLDAEDGENAVLELTPGTLATAEVALGLSHTCVLPGVGAVECRGSDQYGQAPARRVPAEVGTGFIALTAGSQHTCALRDDGVAECWGYSGNGQAPATRSAATGRFVDVEAGGNSSCALRDDGVVECWGYNGYNQGPGPRPASTGRFVDVTAGGYHRCGLRDDGIIECWGRNTENQAPPTRSAATGRFVDVTAGSFHTCALRDDGEAECWGANNYGKAPATRSAATGGFVQVTGGGNYTCALRDDGVVECWGESRFGQAPATRTATAGTFTAVVASADHTCGVSAGAVECWGSNAFGQSEGQTLGPDSDGDGVPDSADPFPLGELTLDIGGPYTGDEGAPVQLRATGSSDPAGTGLTYTWDLGDGATASGAEASRTWPDDGTYTVTVTLGNDFGATLTHTATVEVANVAPTATFAHDGPVDEGSGFTLALTDAHDPSPTDAAAGFAFAFDCGDGGGLAAFGTSATLSCPTTQDGSRDVEARIRDKDGGESTYTATVEVLNVAPLVSALPDAEIIRGERYTAAGSFTDPGDDPWTATVVYEGSVEPLTLDGKSFTLDHVYALAGVYGVEVVVSDDDASGAASAVVTVLSPAEAITVLMGMVTELVASGELSGRERRPLLASLEAAAASLDAGNENAALGQLGSFDNKIDALVKSGRLSPAAADELLAYSARIQDSIGPVSGGKGNGRGGRGGGE